MCIMIFPPPPPPSLPPPSPPPPRSTQESFVLSVLTLLRIHLGLVVPLGSGCIDIACGNQVRPLRSLLLQLIDSHLPPAIDKVCLCVCLVIYICIYSHRYVVKH